jgi:hypothetical protein
VGKPLQQNLHQSSLRQPLSTPHGVEVPLDTLLIAQTFCRLMLPLCVGAVPVYLALLMLAVPYDVNFGVKGGLVLLSPISLFLMAAIIYGVAFLVTGEPWISQRPQAFTSIRRRLVHLKLSLIGFGALLLLSGIGWGSVVLVKAHL